MDEILIEEKKYVSSKRAAKITGYAKDYIGQLCREGRVPARLVGRSWYVLESAIQDHRFGDAPGTPSVGKEKESTWEAPRYEASPVEVIPTVNRLRDTGPEFSQHLQDSWRAWFDRVGDIEPTTPAIVAVPEPGKEPEETKTFEIKEEKEVNIPIHTIYQEPPEELLPRIRTSYPREEQGQPIQREEMGGKRTILMQVQLASALIAMFLAITAVIGSGYFDRYIISSKQVMIIAGVALYNK